MNALHRVAAAVVVEAVRHDGAGSCQTMGREVSMVRNTIKSPR
jgi:hypothetical protein